MKDLWGYVMICILVLGGVSCSKNETTDDIASDPNIQFSLKINDLSTKGIPMSSEIGGCLEESELAGMIDQLYVKFSIRLENGTELNDIVREMKYVSHEGEKLFVVNPVALPLGNHQITEFILVKKQGETEKVIYSAVGDDPADADFEAFVPKKYRLPMALNVAEEDKYKKTIFQVVVLCIENMTAEDFGFKLWKLNFTTIHQIPFMVNLCLEGMHTVAKGRLEVWIDGDHNLTQDMGKDKVWTQEGSRKLQELFFEPGSYKKIQFADNKHIPNELEFYRFKMYLFDVDNTEPAWDVVTSVEELLQFKTADAWMKEMRIMDINLCDEIDWIFDREHLFHPENELKNN